MKVYAINGSPRKKCNTATMLKSFIDGVKFVDSNAEVEIINVYDYKYTGCISCFACQRIENREQLGCRVKDDIYDILEGTFHADGIVFASPIYFFDIAAHLRAFLERLLYPGVSERTIPTAFIYTMNASEELKEKYNFEASLSTSKRFLESTFHGNPESIYAYSTFQYNDSDVYNEGFRRYVQDNKLYHEKHFEEDCQKAFDAGVRMAKKIALIQERA